MATTAEKTPIKTITTHYIDGAFVDSHGHEVMDVVRPTDGQVIARVTLGDEEDTRRAIAAARRASTTFGRTTKDERASILRRLHQAVSARVDDLTAAMVEEYGGVVQFARPIVETGIKAFLAAEKGVQELPWTETWGKTTVTLEPVGVAGLITAWNANALFICLKLASAVGAGCTVVLKPSELSSLQTQVMVECINAAQLPKGVCNVVIGRGDIVGAELVRNPDVDKISFTGSVAVGERIMRDGAATMKRVTLELGGKSPTILLDDADLDRAIPAALLMAFLNSGQACAAGTRLLVPRSRLEEIKRRIRDAMRAFIVGNPADPKTAIGPMVSQKQYERVQSYIRKGIEEGAEVLAGGEGHPDGLDAGYFVKPTVFANVKNDMAIAQEEIFGPVLCVIAYDSEDDAIRIANDSQYGLHAAVLGSDLQRARRVASQIRAGRVVINGMTDDPQAPWGGLEYSGVGREYGRYGIEAFLETRAILSPKGAPLMSTHVSISPAEAADRLAIRELVEAYPHCADRRDARGQMALFTEDAHFVVYMDAKDPKPTQELHGRESLAPVFADLNRYAATMHFLGQSTILTLSNDRATGEVYCMPHHLTIDGTKRTLMIAALRYADTYVKQNGVWLYAERRLYVDWIEERPLS